MPTPNDRISFNQTQPVRNLIIMLKLSPLVLVLFILALSCFFPGQIIAAEPKAADLVEDGQLIDLSSEHYQKLFRELQDSHQFNDKELVELFEGVTIKKRVLELMDRQWEAKPYYKYRPLFITAKTIATGKKKLAAFEELLSRVEARFGVDKEIVVAIWGIESRYGTHKGSFPVFQTLNTLFDAYPRRSSFFRKQLVHFLILCRENQMDPLEVKGSYAGAFGQPQFIPSSFREYAVSFDNDQRRDVFNSTEDIFASIANYLRRFHWSLNAPIYIDIGPSLKSQELISANLKGRKGRVDHQVVSKSQGVDLPQPPENRKVSIVGLEIAPSDGGGFRYVAGYPNFQAITQWNHSNRYAMAVTELAEAIKVD